MTPEPKYDVGFSFLNEDLAVARELAELLEPEVSTFVYDRHQEDVGGGDGMSAFARTFKHDVRLAVILLRNRWGHTPMTAVEEAAIKERASHTRFTSFMLVAMEEGVVVPEWIPGFMIYQHGWKEPRRDTAAVIKARARDAGAVMKVETLAESTRRRLREAQKQAERDEFMKSDRGVRAARDEFVRLCRLAMARAQELNAEIPDLQLTVTNENLINPGRIGCVIQQGQGHALSLFWEQQYNNSLSNAYLQIGEGSGFGGRSWSFYDFALLPGGEYGWRFQPNANPDSNVTFIGLFDPKPTDTLVEERLAALVERVLFNHR